MPEEIPTSTEFVY